MLRPERMSKVSMAGSRTVMRDVIEAIHDLRLVHFSDYDGTIAGFETGNPLEGAETAADRLVTVRSLKNVLNVTDEDAGPERIVTESDIEAELPTVRSAVNEFDDRRAGLREELRTVEDAIETAEPFVELGYDLSLLSGYDSLEVAVGNGDPEELGAALEDHEGVAAYGIESADGVLAAFVYPEEDAVLDDAIVGVEFERIEVPDATGDPETYVEELEHRREKLESKLDRIENELEELRLEHAGFLLAAEERLTIQVQRTEIPLQFATTDHAFVAEGWIPTDRYEELAEVVEAAADGKIEVEELEVAEYREYANNQHAPAEETTETTAADGGTVFEADDEPPVIQDNPGLAKPFEVIVEAINRPRYSEYDPTLLVLFTFPLFFGFMIGDIGYGLLYVAVGYGIASRVDSEALKSLAGVAIWSGVFTVLFGILYGEFFGLHFVADWIWGGTAPMHKGFQPNYIAYARAWLLVTLVAALVHVTAGYFLSFLKDLEHGVKEAVYESGSWAMLMLGLWAWIFSRHAMGGKPAFIFEVFNRPITGEIPAENVAYALGFAGLPETVGVAGLAVAAIGLGLLILGEGIVGALESLNVIVNVLSYTRIAAVLLAKAGMALVVNLLFFGAYVHEGQFHFLVSHTPEYAISHYGEAALMFPGLIHMGAIGILGGIVVLIVGHIIVLTLGITSAGLQAVRLEYVEFFGKFYDGGGAKYHPFGHERIYTTED